MKIVVDTNIIFSAILNTNGKIADILMDGDPFEFFAPHFIYNELSKHQDKLFQFLSISTTEQLEELKFLVTQNIKFISEFQIKEKIWIEAKDLTNDIDSEDIVFVAMAEHLKGKVWTGDKKLINGLRKRVTKM